MRRIQWLAAIALLGLVGCRMLALDAAKLAAPAPPTGDARIEYLLRVPPDVLPPGHPLFTQLDAMPAAIRSELELPPARSDVRVYLFEDREQYRSFLDDLYPHLPDRRAYFVATDDELAVYAYWGEQTTADLRHELTHAVLHASLSNVPLWLDEGLAEYFEMPADRDGLNREHVERLIREAEAGWQPDLARLESFTEVSDMDSLDYAEAWAWVHWLLNSSPERRELLIAYLRTLDDRNEGSPIGPQLAGTVENPRAALLEHLRALTAPQPN